MFISVIIPVYNGEKYIAEAIRSVLEQEKLPNEIVVIDDGSTDQSAAIVQSFGERIKYYYQPNAGLSAALNKGIELAKGDTLAFLDVDDLFPKDKLSLQTQLLIENPEVDIVRGKIQYFFENNARKNILYFSDDTYQVHHVLVGAALYRRHVFNTVGLFDTTLNSGMDMDWFVRAKDKKVSTLQHSEVGLLYRRHNDNMTNDVEVTQKGILSVLKKSLERRRTQ